MLERSGSFVSSLCVLRRGGGVWVEGNPPLINPGGKGARLGANPHHPHSTPTSTQPKPTHDDGFLTAKEQDLVVQTWTVLSSDIIGNGVKVFIRINELEPQIVQAFPFRSLTGDALLKSPLFRGHASRFMKAVEVTMDNLGALEVIVIPNLIHLGRQHTRIRGFKVEYLQIFQTAMIDIWSIELGKQFKGDTRKGWVKIFNMITTNVLKGYEQGLSQMDQESRGTGSHSSGISMKSVELTNANHNATEASKAADTRDTEGESKHRTGYLGREGETDEKHATKRSINNSQV